VCHPAAHLGSEPRGRRLEAKTERALDHTTDCLTFTAVFKMGR